MEANELTLNEDKTELMMFCNYKHNVTSIVHNEITLKIKNRCRYLGIIVDDKLNYKSQLNKVLGKMATAIRSIYLVRHKLPLSARITLFKSLVLSHINFISSFFQSLSEKDIQRLNRQINWGIKVCYMRKKFDRARDLLLRSQLLPAELLIQKVSIYKFANILGTYLTPLDNGNYKIYEHITLRENTRTRQFQLLNKCETNWSDKSIIRNFIGKWNTLPTNIRKTNSKNKFKEKINDMIIQKHEKIPFDRTVSGFKKYFY